MHRHDDEQSGRERRCYRARTSRTPPGEQSQQVDGGQQLERTEQAERGTRRRQPPRRGLAIEDGKQQQFDQPMVAGQQVPVEGGETAQQQRRQQQTVAVPARREQESTGEHDELCPLGAVAG